MQENMMMSERRKGLTVKEVVKIFPKFKEKHINYFIGRGVISYPIRDRDLEGVRLKLCLTQTKI
jgi:hypothetical protein